MCFTAGVVESKLPFDPFATIPGWYTSTLTTSLPTLYLIYLHLTSWVNCTLFGGHGRKQSGPSPCILGAIPCPQRFSRGSTSCFLNHMVHVLAITHLGALFSNYYLILAVSSHDIPVVLEKIADLQFEVYKRRKDVIY